MAAVNRTASTMTAVTSAAVARASSWPPTDSPATVSIPRIRVYIWPIGIAGSWVYLTGSRREAIVVFKDIKRKLGNSNHIMYFSSI